MTVLTLLNRVALQAGVPEFNSVISTTSRTAKEMLVHLHEAGEEVTRRAEWQALYKSMSLAAGLTTVAFPSDAHRLVSGAAIVCAATPFIPFTPVRSIDQFSIVSAQPSSSPFYFVSGGQIAFAPAVPAGGAVLRYISQNWITSGISDTATISLDGDVPKLSEPLLALGVLWRYKRAKGLGYDDVLSEFEAELAREILADRGLS